ncbi:hypothetical protein [Pseudonocardia sp.]|uniref:hypothetical protein n=1 Tax=Pseudonocardia sp. TaxID=60912 RepID=UPI0026327683|nr:hypothetical protein [Pseudonocardia sp.]
MTATPYVPPVTRATFRRSAIGAAVAAVLGLAVLVPAGLGMYGLFGVLGLALGVLNSYLTVRSVARFAADTPSKGQFSASVLGRLAVITVLAFVCALLFRPAGVAVFGGLVVFQFVGIVSSMLPLIKEIRQK